MLHERPYMKRHPKAGSRDPMNLCMVLIIAVFVAQKFAETWMGQAHYFVYNVFALSLQHLLQGKIWTLVSHGFLHGNLWHLIGNLFLIFFTAQMLKKYFSSQFVLGVFCVAVLFGAMGSIGVQLLGETGQVIGASAGAMGLLALYCRLQPDRPVHLLLFFVIPIKIKPKWILIFLIVTDGFGFLFHQLPQALGRIPTYDAPSIAYAAHLAGIGAGLLIHWLLSHGIFSGKGVSIEAPAWTKGTFRRPRRTQVNISPESSKTTDELLDKISKQGFTALSEEEYEQLKTNHPNKNN